MTKKTNQMSFDFKDLIYRMKPGSIVRTTCDVPYHKKGEEPKFLKAGEQCVVVKLIIGDVNFNSEQRQGLWEISPSNGGESWHAYGDELEVIFMIQEPRDEFDLWFDDYLEMLTFYQS